MNNNSRIHFLERIFGRLNNQINNERLNHQTTTFYFFDTNVLHNENGAQIVHTTQRRVIPNDTLNDLPSGTDMESVSQPIHMGSNITLNNEGRLSVNDIVNNTTPVNANEPGESDIVNDINQEQNNMAFRNLITFSAVHAPVPFNSNDEQVDENSEESAELHPENNISTMLNELVQTFGSQMSSQNGPYIFSVPDPSNDQALPLNNNILRSMRVLFLRNVPVIADTIPDDLKDKLECIPTFENPKTLMLKPEFMDMSYRLLMLYGHSEALVSLENNLQNYLNNIEPGDSRVQRWVDMRRVLELRRKVAWFNWPMIDPVKFDNPHTPRINEANQYTTSRVMLEISNALNAEFDTIAARVEHETDPDKRNNIKESLRNINLFLGELSLLGTVRAQITRVCTEEHRRRQFSESFGEFISSMQTESVPVVRKPIKEMFVNYSEEMDVDTVVDTTDNQLGENELECITCADADANVRMNPCNHASLCVKCCKRHYETALEKNISCPVCRAEIVSYTYLPHISKLFTNYPGDHVNGLIAPIPKKNAKTIKESGNLMCMNCDKYADVQNSPCEHAPLCILCTRKEYKKSGPDAMCCKKCEEPIEYYIYLRTVRRKRNRTKKD